MPPKDINDEQTQPTLSEGFGLNIKLVIGLCTVLVAATGAFFSLRADVQAVQKDVTGLRTDIDALKQLSSLRIELENLRKNGSDNLKEVRDAVQALREKFELHVATTSGK